MADERDYQVARRHSGDRDYQRGDTRRARPEDVQHLVRLGVLVEGGTKAEKPADTKAAPPLANKAEPPLANKAEPAPAQVKTSTRSR